MYEWVQMGHRIAAAINFYLDCIHYIGMQLKHYKDQRVIYWGWIIAFITCYTSGI